MSQKRLTKDEKLVFVKMLFDESFRVLKADVRRIWAKKTGHSQSLFNDRMCGHRPFKDFELDVVLEAFQEVLGEERYSLKFQEFIDEQSDGDKRTVAKSEPVNDRVQEAAPAPLKRKSSYKSLEEHIKEKGFLIPK